MLALSTFHLANWINRAAFLIAIGAASTGVAQTSGEPVTIGVSGPLTGQNAQRRAVEEVRPGA